jgi:hypothetical protein
MAQDATGSVDAEMASTVLRQGELYLQAQLQSAIASDQRAATMAAFFGSVGTAVAAVTIAYWDKSGDVPILISGLIAAALMAVGACICLWAARPVDFFFPGNHPASWENILGAPIADALHGEALNYQDHIEANAEFLEKNSKMVSKGAMISTAAPLAGIAIWLLASAISLSCPAAKASALSLSQSFEGATSHTCR